MRTKPYSATGIRRVPCARCGKPSHAQWNVCADKVDGKQQFRGLCLDCDIGLNEVAMRYVFGKAAESRLAAYAQAAIKPT